MLVIVGGGGLFPFGFGIGYSTFEYASAPLAPLNWAGDAAIGELAVTVRNVGEVEAADVVLVYRTPPNAGVDGVPLREILGFERVHLPPKGSATLRFPLASHDFELADEGGTFRRVAGRWALVAGGETLAHVDVPPAG